MKPKSLFKRVLSFAVAELERRAQKPFDAPELQSAPAARHEHIEAASGHAEPIRHTRSSAELLEVMRSERGALRVRWALEQSDLERSASLIDRDAVLCLRLVAFTPARDHVVRDVQDRPSVASEGECEIGRVDGRAVVALGLRSGGRFVSIAHHVV